MAKRSLQASDEGIKKAKQAFKRKGWTQEYLATEVGLETRQPIWKFFTGKPVDRHVFNDICFVLELDTSEIAQHSAFDDSISVEISEPHTLDIDVLVQKLRYVHHERIQAQCGTLHILDIARPINLNDLYIDVNIFEEITSKRWLEITDLQRLESYEVNHSGFSKVYQERITGLEAVRKYSQILVLGKPGSGKTTFLQSIAISCNQGIFQPNYLPIFINLKNFVEDYRSCKQLSLFNYIYDYFINLGITETELATVFSHGRALILLDGLDEVIGEASEVIVNKIRNFIDKFYKNKIIISCRLAAESFNFSGFTAVEIADFNKAQIAAFAHKWFLTVTKNSPVQAQTLAHKFMQKLELAENAQILELATTPILLNLTCLVFQSGEDFPSNHSELYKQAVDLLLVRWDEARGIKRDQVYRNLSLLHKIKLLSYIAAISFHQGNYFITAAKIQYLIADYLSSLPNANTDPDALEIESAAVLRAIELQHGLLIERARGIYSFSHLIFQEYFTAREIIANANPTTLLEFVNHLHEKRWREVFLLSVGMLNPADDLFTIMKAAIDQIPSQNEQLHKFMRWVEQKASQVDAAYHCASVRAFYFTIALPPTHPLACNQDLAITLDHQLAGSLVADLALDLALTYALAVSLTMSAEIFSQRLAVLHLSLDLKYLLANQPSLQASLQELASELPHSQEDRETLRIWWYTHGQAWTEELRSLMIRTRQIGYDWQLLEQDYQYLQQYWDANKLLLDCLHTASNVSHNIKNMIEQNLFSLG
ncbi:putative NTPase (NACHT family) [Nostoc sp. PCC 7524]|uniref:NACHT domain-containing protein n=1 Tax=Nostoc sp. (strain ATCC 29411 / PCC 7524) TaxID=28072 RepID=UPI00029EEBF1|nr:NACHT domain-containing NTPase [Nostoc sp. PCC 7524]AFY48324.1 putative NTPase (NACHT family) [Nostoc sp. PCC 7524]